MPAFLRDFKRSLERDLGRVGKKPNGDYKFKPPNIVARKIKDYPDLNVSKITPVERPGLNAITFSALVKSESTPIKYKVSVQFHEVNFSKKENELCKIPFESLIDGKLQTMFREFLKVKKHPVMIKCQCSDFRHRFETEAADSDALIGRPRKYRRKTPAWPVGRPYANSTNKIGFCKHINSLLTALNEEDLLGE